MVAAFSQVTDLTAAIAPNPLIISPQTPIIDVIVLLSQTSNHCSLTQPPESTAPPTHPQADCVLVVEQGNLVGLCTEQDMVRFAASGASLAGVTVAEVMSVPEAILTLSHSTNLLSVLQMFRHYPTRHLPVLDDEGHILGVITPASLRNLLQPVDVLRLRLISEMMSSEVVQVSPMASILNVACLMTTHQVSCALIVDRPRDESGVGSRPLGIITERDIVQCQTMGLDLARVHAQAVMSSPLFCLGPQHSLWVAHQEMQRRCIRRIVVTDPHDRLLGVVTETSILKALDPEEVSRLIQGLQHKIHQLESERITLLEYRNRELAQRVQQRTAQLQRELMERRRIEQALSRSEATNRAMLEAIPDLMIRMRRDGTYLDFIPTQAFEIVMPKLDLKQKNVFDIMPLPIAQERMHYIEQALQTGTTQSYEFALELRGERRYQEARIVVSGPDEVLVMIRDITDRKQATEVLCRLNQELEQKVEERTATLQHSEERLRQSEELLRLTIDHAPIGIATVDLNGRFLTVNRAFCDSLGYETDELLQHTCLDVTHADDRAAAVVEMERLIQEEVPRVQLQQRYLHCQGDAIDVGVWMSLVRNPEGDPVQFVLQVEDIRDRKRAEQEMQRALEQEKALAEMRSRFIAMTSHEFRTPLAIIASSAGLLEKYSHKLDEAKKARYLNQIQLTVTHMTQLLDDILTLHQADTGYLSCSPVAFDMIAFCASLVEDVQQSVGDRAIVFVPPTLEGQQAEALKSAQVDPKLLYQILTNLLSNAIKYSAVESVVQLRLMVEPDRLLFQVQDQGIGIPPKEQPQLFEVFYRAANVGSISGSGLGLAIVKRLVELLQGQISVSSELGQGTAVTVCLPLRRED